MRLTCSPASATATQGTGRPSALFYPWEGSVPVLAGQVPVPVGEEPADEEEDERLNLMLIDLVDWFKQTTSEKYGGIDCDFILEGKRENLPTRCPVIIQFVFQKCKELLVDYGFDLSGNRDEN